MAKDYNAGQSCVIIINQVKKQHVSKGELQFAPTTTRQQ